ncbi:TcpQ domain-containing protein [Pseudescherichia sp.]|uniref:TcpQ domain-containing protein n=1 Tax=Pseudescherichia sp. TaxID=2055881 RepID=UPI00289A47E4|nr:TcpQ domain-containing protein [Pseudescherichia sp.]
MRYAGRLLCSLLLISLIASEAAAVQQARNPFSSAASPTVPAMIIHENELLSQGVNNWVVTNGYKLYWNSKKDYLVYNDITLTGKTDDDVLQALGELFFSENYGLVVKKYEKNRVIVIDEM